MDHVISITKIDAARRQLRTAIRLFFEHGDAVSIHTLVAAAHGVLHDLALAQGEPEFRFDGTFTQALRGSFVKDIPLIREDKKRIWINGVNEAQNFFKHADRDNNPDVELQFRPGITELLLFDALMLYTQVKRKGLREGLVFLVWFYCHNTDLIAHDQVSSIIKQMTNTISNWNDRSLFLEILQNLPSSEHYE